MEKINFPSDDDDELAGLPDASPDLYDALLQRNTLIKEEKKIKKIRFNELWSNINLLKDISILVFDNGLKKPVTYYGKDMVEKIYKNFPSFFESDKGLNEFSLEDLKDVDNCVENCLMKLLKIQDSFPGDLGKRVESFLAKRNPLTMDPEIQQLGYGPSLGDVYGIDDHYTKIGSKYASNQSKKIIDYCNNLDGNEKSPQ